MKNKLQKIEPFAKIIIESILFSIIFTILMWICHTLGLIEMIEWYTPVAAVLGWGMYKVANHIYTQKKS